MKRFTNRISGISALTRTDVIVIVAAVSLLIAIGYAGISYAREKANSIKCTGIVKSIAMGVKIFASDNSDRYPYQVRPALTLATPNASVSMTNLPLADPASHGVWTHWAILSNELGSPKILVCPGNRAKRNNVALDWTTNRTTGYLSSDGWEQMSNVHHGQDDINYERKVGYDVSTSYFISLTAEEANPKGLLLGDANVNWEGNANELEINPAAGGVQALNRQRFREFRFVSGVAPKHRYQHHRSGGNVAQCDGSVSWLTANSAGTLIESSISMTNEPSLWLVVPK